METDAPVLNVCYWRLFDVALWPYSNSPVQVATCIRLENVGQLGLPVSRRSITWRVCQVFREVLGEDRGILIEN